jgi:ketosteroid isomerase-like protein
MKNLIPLSIAIFFCSHLLAQNTEALIKAEIAFEKSCLENGIRDGFLAHVDSNGIEFMEKGPVDAKKFWRSLPVFEGVFSWSPTYAEMSISGNWGYTSGNYEHRPKSINDTVDESGQYTTVWHQLENGKWKYLIDIGNNHQQRPLDKYPITIDPGKFSAGKNTSQAALLEQENLFIQSFEKNIGQAYHEMGSVKYILNITSSMPVTSTDSAVVILGKIPSLKYHPVGAKISSGNDMAAIYGTFNQTGKTGSYLRIWRHEKDGWKIALEVIRI